MSHIAAIGFDASDAEEFRQMITGLMQKNGVPHYDRAGNCYYCLGDKSGAQIWLFISDKNEIVGFTPHFAGESQFPVSVTQKMGDKGNLEGRWHAWANPLENADPEKGLFPFLFECPDLLTFIPPILPWFTQIQLAAFAHEIEFWPDEAAYSHAQTEEKMKLAPEAFIPLGLFTDAEQSDQEAMAYFTGTVLSSKERMNGLTEQTFFSAKVKTLGGEVDLVWTPALYAKLPPAGSIVRSVAWLSGRILNRPRLKGRGLGGLFWGRKS